MTATPRPQRRTATPPALTPSADVPMTPPEAPEAAGVPPTTETETAAPVLELPPEEPIGTELVEMAAPTSETPTTEPAPAPTPEPTAGKPAADPAPAPEPAKVCPVQTCSVTAAWDRIQAIAEEIGQVRRLKVTVLAEADKSLGALLSELRRAEVEHRRLATEAARKGV